ncbi:Exportin-2 [Babesia sp. Xinjiang]|uniref:Exportin-2 n=1 Tax=Babesia sp. Xinjiang TaxID=462227 RepID=UPI000A22655C|nr:Exportin-2 [Babesia sp. Xinjiang]ORM40684.1 Exportin-2 [Babesia sp. Xinjiang]
MADVEFTATLVTLCRQTLSGDHSAIRSAEETLKVLLQPSGSDIRLRLATLFRIILVPSALVSQPTVIADDDLNGVSSELQLWVAICLKNYVWSHFDTSESHGGVSDDLRRLVRCFLIVAVLNTDKLDLDKNVFKQLEETLHMLAEDDFPYHMDFAILFIQYCHLSDVAPEAIAITYSQRVQKAAAMRGQVNVGESMPVSNSESLARSLEEAKSTVHLAYGESCAKLLSAYAAVQQSLVEYSKVLATGELPTISRSYSGFYRNLLLGLEAMCEGLNGVTLSDLDLGKFLQAAAFLFPQEPLCIHVVNHSTNTRETKREKGDPLIYFDDRQLYKDESLWGSAVSTLPKLGSHGQWVTLAFSGGTSVNDAALDVTYFRRKAHTLRIFKRLMKKYKTSVYGDETLRELKIVLSLSENMLLYVYRAILSKLNEFVSMLSLTGTSCCLSRIVLDLLEALTSITKIFTYIHAIDLPECCEDNIDLYLGSMVELLRFSDPVILQVGHLGVVPKLKVAICKLMRYYAERYQEVFHPFVFQCIDGMVELCRGLSQNSDDDRLCSAILEFLTAAASTHWGPRGNRTNPFTNSEYLADIIRGIVLPHIGFRECDLFLIEDCASEFVQRELDTGTGHSRRFSAINFLKKLVSTYGQMVQHLLNQFAQNVSSANDYKLKELYLQIIICSNFTTNEGFNLHTYFSEHLRVDLLRESQSLQNTQDNILIVMAILKFVFTFKKHFPVTELTSLISPITSFLRHPNDAVRFLAAETLNRIAPLVRENKDQLKQPMLQALECLLKLMQSEAPNEFYVRCLMRIFQFLRQDVCESGFLMLSVIVERIKVASNNPVNPIYNHYLFECLAILLRTHLEAGSLDAVSRIEQVLIPMIAIIIQQDMHPFVPYGLQILYILLRASQQPGPTYVQLFSHLVCIDNWKSSTANAQGAVKLLVCYFERYTLFEQEIMGNMERILSIFHFCLTHRKLSMVSLDILNGVFRYLPVAFYSKFIGTIVTVLLTFLHNMKISNCVPRVITSIALLATSLHMQNYTPGFVDILEGIQSGITQSFLQVVYLPNARKVLALESKRVLVVGTSIILGSPVVQRLSETFAMLADFLGELIQGQTLRVVHTSVEPDDIMEDLDFDVSYVRLRSADDSKGTGSAKLLDPTWNVEQVVRGALLPAAATLRQLPPGRSSQVLLNLLN